MCCWFLKFMKVHGTLLSVVAFCGFLCFFLGFCVMFSWVAHIQVKHGIVEVVGLRLVRQLRQLGLICRIDEEKCWHQSWDKRPWAHKHLPSKSEWQKTWDGMCCWFLKFMKVHGTLLSVVAFCGFLCFFLWLLCHVFLSGTHPSKAWDCWSGWLEACKAAKAARIDLSHWWGKVLAPELRQASMSTQTLALQIWVTKDLRRDVLLVSEVHGSSWHFTFCRCFLWFLMFLSLAFVSCFLEWHTSK